MIYLFYVILNDLKSCYNVGNLKTIFSAILKINKL